MVRIQWEEDAEDERLLALAIEESKKAAEADGIAVPDSPTLKVTLSSTSQDK